MQGVCVGARVATVCRVNALRPAWGPTAMTWRLGVDIGGTFTDFALFDESGYEIEVTLPGGGIGAGYAEVFARLDELFRARYAEIFAETFLDEPLEIVSWKVEAAGEEAALAYASIAAGARARKVWFGDAFVECEALDRYALEVGTTVEGPAVIKERESTCVLGPGDRATVDARLNLVAELANDESDS